MGMFCMRGVHRFRSSGHQALTDWKEERSDHPGQDPREVTFQRCQSFSLSPR